MCGILGWFGPQQSFPDRDRFNSALSTISHRGPDDSGMFADEKVCFGHRRLAVIGVESGKQPWVDQETGVVLNYNGELYNYIEERKVLESLGHKFRSDSDTEVLLRMYLEYGTEMLARVNGMFAFAIYDPRENHLFCARDHIGIKPFYYYQDRESFWFSSEVKALVNYHGSFEPEQKAIADYISLQYVLGEKTFFKNVYKLLPGEYLIVNGSGQIKKHCYWDIDPREKFSGSFEDAASQLNELLRNAVKLQLRSDVPLGAHLSGGLDTASVCALAAEHIAPRTLSTFTAAFKEGGIFDDTEYAEITSQHLGSQHFVSYPTELEFQELYPELVWHLDEPMAAQGVFPQYIVSRLAKEHVTVVLGGQGADEVLGGYTRYYILLLDQAIRNGATGAEENLGISWEELGQSLPQLHHYGSLWSALQSSGAYEEPARRYFRLIDRSSALSGALSPDFISSLEGYSPYETYLEYFNGFPEAELLDRVLYFESKCWLPALLHIEDRMSMAVSLESRVPLLDPELIKFAFSLPTRIKMHSGRTKSVMREAFSKELAPEISRRRDKLGFPVPTNAWFAGGSKGFIHDILLSQDARNRGIFEPSRIQTALSQESNMFDRSLWGMLNIELLHRNFSSR